MADTAMETERDSYVKRISELEDVLRSCALEVVERERVLIQTLSAEDVEGDLKELTTNINESTSEDRREFMARFRSSRTSTSKWSPEKALRMALRSLSSSIEYFENERDLFLLKNDGLKSDKAASDEIADKLKDQISRMTQERNEWRAKYQDHEEEMEMLQELKDQVEDLEGERDRLSGFNLNLQSELEFLRTLKSDQESKMDDDYEASMAQMQNTIEVLELENSKLREEAEMRRQSEKENPVDSKLKRFDDKFHKKAVVSKDDEFQARINELGDEKFQLEQLARKQNKAYAKLESERSALKLQYMELEKANEELRVKGNSLEGAVSLVSEERAKLRNTVWDLEEEKAMLLIKCESHAKSFEVMQHTPNQPKPKAAWRSPKAGHNEQELLARIEELEDEQAILAAKCTNQQSQMLLLGDELGRIAAAGITKDSQIAMLEHNTKEEQTQQDEERTRMVESMKVQVEEMEELLQSSEAKCQEQQETIATVAKELERSEASEQELEKGNKELGNKIHELEAQVKSSDTEHDRLRDAAQEKESELGETVASLQSRILEMENRLTQSATATTERQKVVVADPAKD